MKRVFRVMDAMTIALLMSVICIQPRGVHASTTPIPCGGVCVTTHAYDNNQDNVNSSETVFKATNWNSPTHTATAGVQGIV